VLGYLKLAKDVLLGPVLTPLLIPIVGTMMIYLT